MSSGRFAKREREKAKRERAESKRERRDIRRADAGTATTAAPVDVQASVMAELASLHEALDDGRISFDDFEVAKAALLEQLRI